MSVQNAIRFIARLRADEALRKELAPSGELPGLAGLVGLGGKIGLAFAVEELRAAHKYDWGMRDISYDNWVPP